MQVYASGSPQTSFADQPVVAAKSIPRRRHTSVSGAEVLPELILKLRNTVILISDSGG
jgi:hypothetical protein